MANIWDSWLAHPVASSESAERPAKPDCADDVISDLMWAQHVEQQICSRSHLQSPNLDTSMEEDPGIPNVWMELEEVEGTDWNKIVAARPIAWGEAIYEVSFTDHNATALEGQST